MISKPSPEEAQKAVNAMIQIVPLDTSLWPEFDPEFFAAPESKSTIFEWNELIGDGGHVRRMAGCVQIASRRDNRDEAIADLRAALFKLALDGRVTVTAYLAKPSIMPTIRPLQAGETGDTQVALDLRGPRPAQTCWVAFCLLHGEIFTPLDVDVLHRLGVDIAREPLDTF